MKKILSLFTLACITTLFLTKCKDKLINNYSRPVVLNFYLNKASFSYLSNKTVYLQNSKTRIVIDSLKISSNKSKFLIDPSIHDLSLPYLIFFYDSVYNVNTGQSVKLERVLGYHNPFYKRVFSTSFYIESGMNALYFYIYALDTKLGKRVLPDEFVDLSTAHKSLSPQNDIALKNITLSHTKNKLDSAYHFKYNKKIIRKYPYSFFLLEQLYLLKENFSKEEITTLLSFFDDSIKDKTLYQLIRGYINNIESYDQVFPFSINLENSNKIIKEIGVEKAKYHLIIFWAWWCKPCREEIPSLKQLYSQKKNIGLNIYSVSTDQEKNKWREALIQEKMPWEQFIVDQDSYAQLMSIYDLTLIPKSYLFDSSYKLIRSFSGFDTKSFQELVAILK